MEEPSHIFLLSYFPLIFVILIKITLINLPGMSHVYQYVEFNLSQFIVHLRSFRRKTLAFALYKLLIISHRSVHGLQLECIKAS